MDPNIYLLSRPQFDVSEFLRFLETQRTTWDRSEEPSESEEIVEVAGRICYMSFGSQQAPKSNAEYIQRLISLGHESVLEHVSWTFLITGVSRSFTHQLVRHRVGFAFSQLSQQYHDEREAEFVFPPSLKDIPEARREWEEAVATAKRAYAKIVGLLGAEGSDLSNNLSRKEARRAIRSAARSILPNATETKIVVTANARAVRHFLRVRGCLPGDIEMRLVSSKLLGIVSAEAPALVGDFRVENLPDGSPIVIHEPIERSQSARGSG